MRGSVGTWGDLIIPFRDNEGLYFYTSCVKVQDERIFFCSICKMSFLENEDFGISCYTLFLLIIGELWSHLWYEIVRFPILKVVHLVCELCRCSFRILGYMLRIVKGLV